MTAQKTTVNDLLDCLSVFVKAVCYRFLPCTSYSLIQVIHNHWLHPTVKFSVLWTHILLKIQTVLLRCVTDRMREVKANAHRTIWPQQKPVLLKTFLYAGTGTWVHFNSCITKAKLMLLPLIAQSSPILSPVHTYRLLTVGFSVLSQWW